MFQLNSVAVILLF